MLWLLILVSGKNIEYSQAVGKSCSEKVAILKKPAVQILWTCGQRFFKINIFLLTGIKFSNDF